MATIDKIKYVANSTTNKDETDKLNIHAPPSKEERIIGYQYLPTIFCIAYMVKPTSLVKRWITEATMNKIA